MAIKLTAIWSDGESKLEKADRFPPVEADWSDGESIIFVTTIAVSKSKNLLLGVIK